MYWYEGKLWESPQISLDVNEPGLIYGATVFTTLRVYGGELESELTGYDRHCQRLETNLKDLGFQTPDWERVKEGALRISDRFEVVRITIFPSGKELISGRELPPQLEQWQTEGVRAMLAPPEYARSLPQYKTGNYLAPWLARQWAHSQEAIEAILTNDRGDWLETATGNLWGYRDDCWYTPCLSGGILPGIARSQTIARLTKEGKPVREIEWHREWVKDLESIGYTNCVVGFIGIHSVLTKMGTLYFKVRMF